MNTEKFSHHHREASESFSLTPRLKAERQFRTDTSISFELLPDADKSANSDYNFAGWADVHHPVEGPFKVIMKIDLPKEFESEIPLMIEALFEKLEIPQDETYIARLLPKGTSNKVWLRSVDREGRDWGHMDIC